MEKMDREKEKNKSEREIEKKKVARGMVRISNKPGRGVGGVKEKS